MATIDDLKIFTKDIRRSCGLQDIRFHVVMELCSEYLTPSKKGFGDDEYAEYKLNSKGLLFVGEGCWSGINNKHDEEVKRIVNKDLLTSKQIEAIGDSKKRSDQAKCISIWAIAVSFLTLLWSVVQRFCFT
jgi:hypothetical protein